MGIPEAEKKSLAGVGAQYLQSYFRLNSPESGQFEHTLIIVDEGASLHFIEGCSAPKYNKVNLHAGCVELYVKRQCLFKIFNNRKLVKKHDELEY